MKSKTLSTVFLSVISLVNLVPVASALEVSIGSGATQEITQENVNKLTPEQIEQAKMILPANFRIR